MKKYIQIYFLAIALLSLEGCRDEMPTLVEPKYYKTDNYKDIFEGFWNGMNNNYLFWDIDATNWDHIYDKYKPLFEKLKYNEPTDDTTAYNYFVEMTEGLIDHHYTLSFTAGALKGFPSLSPSINKMKKAGMFKIIPSDLFSYFIDSVYFSTKNSISSNFYIVNGPNDTIISFSSAGMINNDILYFRFPSFSLAENYSIGLNGKNTEFLKVFNFFANTINSGTTKGLILDLRDNQGGSYSDLDFLLRFLVGQKTEIAKLSTKQGEGRLDYTPWVPMVITPLSGASDYNQPLVVLTSSLSASMSELITISLKSILKQCFVVGEQTTGATGSVSDNAEYLNGGNVITDIYTINMAQSRTFSTNGVIYEGIGITPDYNIPFDVSEVIRTGRDPQLDFAINLIRAKR